MKTLSSYFSIATFAVLTLWLGCTNSPTDSDSDLIIPDVQTEQTIAADDEAGALPSFPTSFLTLLDERFDVFVVRLIWGSGSDATLSNTAAVNWSGSLFINAEGALRVRRTIGFEHGQDELFPGNTFHAISWRSITEGDRDGVEVEVYLRNDVDYIMEPRLFFETDPLAVSFSFDQLQRFDTLIQVEGVGALAVRAHKFERARCPHGSLAGHWRFLHDGEGKFEGAIFYRQIVPIGRLAGRFWTTDTGERFFAGRWESLEGIFHGDIRGRWDFDPDDASCLDCRNHTGRFKGQFFTEDGRKLGNLYGRFGDGDDLRLSNSDPKTGRFKGFWGVDCDRDGAK